MPPLFPCSETNPLALVVSIHLNVESLNELEPASNRLGVEFDPLKSALFNCTQITNNLEAFEGVFFCLDL